MPPNDLSTGYSFLPPLPSRMHHNDLAIHGEIPSFDSHSELTDDNFAEWLNLLIVGVGCSGLLEGKDAIDHGPDLAH